MVQKKNDGKIKCYFNLQMSYFYVIMVLSVYRSVFRENHALVNQIKNDNFFIRFILDQKMQQPRGKKLIRVIMWFLTVSK